MLPGYGYGRNEKPCGNGFSQAPGCVEIIAKLWGLMGNHAVRSWLTSGQGAEKQDIPGEKSDTQEFG